MTQMCKPNKQVFAGETATEYGRFHYNVGTITATTMKPVEYDKESSMSNLSLFYDTIQHDDSSTLLFPNHQPEVTRSGWYRSLHAYDK